MSDTTDLRTERGLALTFTTESFLEDVLRSPVPVLVGFSADWCSACRGVEALLDRVARAFTGAVRVGRVDVDDAPALTRSLGIESVPTLLFVRGGKIVGRQVGAVSASDLIQRLEKLTAGA